MEVGQIIKELREKKNLTQEDLGRAVGAKQPRDWASKIETGYTKDLKMKYAIPLAKLLDVEISYFYTNDPVTYPQENKKNEKLEKVDEDPRMDYKKLAIDPLKNKNRKEIIIQLTDENRCLLRENAYLKSLLLKHKIEVYNVDNQNDTV